MQCGPPAVAEVDVHRRASQVHRPTTIEHRHVDNYIGHGEGARWDQPSPGTVGLEAGVVVVR